MLTELKKRIDEHSENFNKELETVKKKQKQKQSEVKNTINEVKTILWWLRW